MQASLASELNKERMHRKFDSGLEFPTAAISHPGDSVPLVRLHRHLSQPSVDKRSNETHRSRGAQDS